MRDVFQVPATPSTGTITELADGTRRYRKMLVKFGTYVDPNDPTKKMVLDETWAGKLIKNFQKHITHSPVVEGHPKTSAELLAATRGDLVGMAVEKDGLYGEIDIKKADTADAIDKDLVKDVSISYDPNYRDKSTGDFIGPLLRHTGLVNDPYITGMEPFQALADDANVIMLSENKESTVSRLKNTKEFAVKVTIGGKEVEIQPGAEIEVPEAELEAATKQVTEAVKPEPTAEEKAQAEKEAADAKAATDKEAADKKAAEDKAAEDTKNAPELSDREKALQVQLSESQAKLAARDAEDAYTKLLKAGKLVPAQKDAFIALSTSTTAEVSLSDGSNKPLSELLTNLISAGPKRISFSEDGKPEGEASPFDQLTPGEQEASIKMGITADEYNKTNSTTKASKSDKGEDEE